MQVTDPAITFILVLAIGIIAGLLFDRLAGPSWLARQFSGSTRGSSRAHWLVLLAPSLAIMSPCCLRSAAG